jgi:hypothetical protein
VSLRTCSGAAAYARVSRLGSTAARLKLKGIDGDPHKQRSVWFNSTQREEPYLGLTWPGQPWKQGVPVWDRVTGAAWLSSARVVRCWVKSRNERNPRRVLGCHPRLPGQSRRKVGMTSSQHGLYVQGDTHATMAATMGRQGASRSESQQKRSQCGLQAATRLHEVGVASNRRSAHGGEYVLGSCTHRPSHHGSWEHPKPVS